MSDDEEMTDLSQAATQSGSYAFTSLSSSNKEVEREPYARIKISKITRRRLGHTGPSTYQTEVVRTFGKKFECNHLIFQLNDVIEMFRTCGRKNHVRAKGKLWL